MLVSNNKVVNTGNILRPECVAWVERSYLARGLIDSADCGKIYADEHTGRGEVLDATPGHD